MIEFLRNNRGHANPVSIALNIITVIVGAAIFLFDPKFLPINGIAFFAAFLLAVQLIHVVAFGTTPITLILSTVIILASLVVLKLGLGESNFIIANSKAIIVALLVLYLIKEPLD